MGSPFTGRTKAPQTEEQLEMSRAALRPHSIIRKLEKPGKCITTYKMPEKTSTFEEESK